MEKSPFFPLTGQKDFDSFNHWVFFRISQGNFPYFCGVIKCEEDKIFSRTVNFSVPLCLPFWPVMTTCKTWWWQTEETVRTNRGLGGRWGEVVRVYGAIYG